MTDNEDLELVKLLTEGLGISLDGLDVTRLMWPVIEGGGPEHADDGVRYLKFMSDGGVLDDELGQRFEIVCIARGTEFKPTSFHRARSGYFDRTKFPDLKDE